ncbi:MAG: alcohol dehydrogenase catalytic domain-containing protein [Eubacterium sp.]|nr:alcohol dehydrogenase catalytic domain-containing protein [Eubacterium sp.]
MLNTVYRLVAPGRFEVEFSDVELNSETAIVRPTHLSICHADQRYYQGLRPPAVMREKLPMALIHEGIGEVVWDGSGTYHPGDRVVMVPNTPTEDDPVVAENYRRSSRFRSSGYDGYMQDLVDIRPDRLLAVPDAIDSKVAAFTELVSVSTHALRRLDAIAHERRERIGIWGDGNLGFLTALMCRHMFPETELYIFGMNRSKLMEFSFADETFLTAEVPEDLEIDHALECVGSEGSRPAIEQIIDHIRPEGAVALLGVSENPIAINTRMVLEKGLRFFGNSRSGVEDFRETLRVLEECPEVAEELHRIIGHVVEVHTIDDMRRAFELDQQSKTGKTVMVWKK